LAETEVAVGTEPTKSETRNLVLFYIVTLAFTWFFWISEALALQGRLGPSAFTNFILSDNNPAAWGPLIGAFVLTYWTTRKTGIIKLLKRAVDYRFNKVWLIPTILYWPVIMGVGLLAASLAGEELPALDWVANPLILGVYFVQVLLFQGPLQEEFGWRGYALDRLQSRFSALISSIILGLMWGVWHLPYLFWIGDEVIYELLWAFMLSNIIISIGMTWLYNNTGGSLLVALLHHTMFNFSNYLFPALETQTGSMVYTILMIVGMIVMIRVWGSKRLVREPQID